VRHGHDEEGTSKGPLVRPEARQKLKQRACAYDDNLAVLVELAAGRARIPDALDPVARSDREGAMEDWLREHVPGDTWQLAGALLSLGLGTDDLDQLAGRFSRAGFSAVLQLTGRTATAYSLLEQITHGARRISEIVTALKAYTYMDRAPVQEVDVHEGLDNTLVMLQGELKPGVVVERHYAADVPRVQARGSELNQVWTNLIDNAIDAMGGNGRLVVRTSTVGNDAVVEIEDNGAGIAPEHLGRVFDPFFTTKRPGQGTGLGLNIAFNIVRGAGGQIDVRSQPASTVFRVSIPAHRSANGSEQSVG
jgi:signal transduction histidine kinase